MSNLIDRDALIVEINGWIYDDDDYPKTDKQRGYNSGLRKAIRLCEKALTVEAEPVRHGYWIVKKTANGVKYTICSECKTDFKFKTDKGTFARLDMRGANYCPNCGAKLDKTEDDA